MPTKRYIMQIPGASQSWWEWIYFRNYKLWNTALSEADINRITQK